MTTTFLRFLRDESGATAIEYSLMAAIVGIGIISSMTTLRDAIATQYTTTNTALTKTY